MKWLLQSVAFVRLFTGSLLASFSDRFYQMAIVAMVLQTFGDASSQLAWVALAGISAQFIFYPVLGFLVDTADRHRLLWGICMIKGFLVLGFIPLFQMRDAASLNQHWPVLIGLLFLMSVISVPFAPSRASVIPDLLPSDQQPMAASMIAFSGILGILLGICCGTALALTWGIIPVFSAASVLFLTSFFVLWGLPRQLIGSAMAKEAPAENIAGLRAQWLGMRRGLAYGMGKRGILGLYVFEALFWIVAFSFYVLLEWYASTVLGFFGATKATFFSAALGLSGVGLLGGALLMGKLCRTISPIFSLPPSFILLGLSFALIFDLSPAARAVPKPNLTEALTVLSPWLILFGFGGGLILGRVDADLLRLTDKNQRGRVFALKGMAYTSVILGLLLFFGLTGSVYRHAVALALPEVLCWIAIPAILMAWVIDTGIYGGGDVVIYSGLQEKMSYYVARFLSYIIARIYFRISIVGAEKIPMKGAVILSPNHGSFLDPILVGIVLPRRIQYMMHASYYHTLGHPFFRCMMTVPVDTSSQIRALKTMSKALEQEICIGIFPEGKVTDNGNLQKPQSGATFLAKRSGAPIYPVAIKGNIRAFRRQHWFPRPFKITIVIGDRIDVPPEASKEDLARITDDIMVQVAKMLGEPPPPKCADS